MNSIEAMKLALEHGSFPQGSGVIHALRQAIASAEGTLEAEKQRSANEHLEPVAWLSEGGNFSFELWHGSTPLFTSPPQRQPLTDGLPCCGYMDAAAIKWNEFNHAVQCHNCGHTYTQTPNTPLTLDYIDQHIGADEGDREAVVALVREVEAAHGITSKGLLRSYEAEGGSND